MNELKRSAAVQEAGEEVPPEDEYRPPSRQQHRARQLQPVELVPLPSPLLFFRPARLSG